MRALAKLHHLAVHDIVREANRDHLFVTATTLSSLLRSTYSV